MSEPKQSGLVLSLLNDMPGWAKGMVFAFLTLPISLAISGMLLNVNVGANIDKYLEIVLARQAEATDASADRIISVVDERMVDLYTRLEDVTRKTDEMVSVISKVDTDLRDIRSRVVAIENWACDHAQVQGLRQDAPTFCGNPVILE